MAANTSSTQYSYFSDQNEQKHKIGKQVGKDLMTNRMSCLFSKYFRNPREI